MDDPRDLNGLRSFYARRKDTQDKDYVRTLALGLTYAAGFLASGSATRTHPEIIQALVNEAMRLERGARDARETLEE